MPAAAGRVGLSGLHAVGFGQRRRRNRLRQRADRVREVHRVEQVEDLAAELESLRPPVAKCFAKKKSACLKLGPWIELRSRLPNVPGAGVANAAGFRNSRPPSLMNGIDAGDEVGPAHVARGAAAGRVDDRHAIRRRVGEDVPRRIAIDDVGRGR